MIMIRNPGRCCSEKGRVASFATAGISESPRIRNHRKPLPGLMSVAFALLVLSVPNCSLYIILQLYDYERTLEIFSNVYLFGHLSNKLYIANSALNFFLYCIGGSKFRRNLVEIFQSCCPCLKKVRHKTLQSTRSIMTLTSVSIKVSTTDGTGAVHDQ